MMRIRTREFTLPQKNAQRGVRYPPQLVLVSVTFYSGGATYPLSERPLTAICHGGRCERRMRTKLVAIILLLIAAIFSAYYQVAHGFSYLQSAGIV
jgi:hypothetical protein